MMDLTHKEKDLFLASANLTLISHVGVNLMRWTILRVAHLIALLLHIAAALLCWWLAWGIPIAVIIALSALSQYLLYRFARASINLNLGILKRMQAEYENYTSTTKTHRSASRPPLALH